MMSRFISRLAASIEPYVPGEQPKDKKYIKLNTNENPYPPSKAVIESIKQSVSENLRLYPDPVATAARQAVAEYYNKILKLEGQNQLTFDNVFMEIGRAHV